jgi:hypothetical protein
MKRREAIKNLSLGIGYMVSAPAVLGILQSCSKAEPDWNAVFFDDELRPLVNQLVDIILPATDSPGGLDLNLPQFVDKMCDDILTKTDREWVLRGGSIFVERVVSHAGGAVNEASRNEVLEVFKSYFDLSPEEKKAVMEGQQKGESGIDDEEKDSFAIYKFLFALREFSLLGYFTSERIGKDFLVFDPIPGGYKPCIPLSEVGNAWTIG